MDYSEFARPKPHKEKKAPKPLKSNYKPIPLPVRRAVLTEKGAKCFFGFCENCGGQAICTINDDFHHHPKRSRGGKDIVDHLWPCRRECHSYYELHPGEEKELFQRIRAAGFNVIDRAEVKNES